MKIALLGDIAFFGKNTIDNPNIKTYLSEVSALLATFDYVVGNLEAPLCENIEPVGSKSAFIKSDLANIELLKYLQINAVSLANNHSFDFGDEGLNQTIQALKDNSIEYFGVDGKNLILAKDKVKFEGYCCYSSSPLGVQNGRIHELSYDRISSDIDSDDNFTICGVHAGLEHVNCPDYVDIKLARKLAKIAPYVYWGHHPHVMQGIETVLGSVLAYSLGNFIFDDVYTPKSEKPLVRQTENNKTSIILVVEVVDGKLISSKEIGIFASDENLIVDYAPAIEKLNEYSTQLGVKEDIYTSSRNILLNDYIDSRKKLRDLRWYLERLNFSSLRIILDGRKNRRLRNEKVVQRVSNDNSA